MKRIISLAVMCLMACVAFSQNLLEITDISQPNDVYTGDNDRAAVIFKCNQSIPLTFESSMDKSATPYNTELEGSDMVYYIEFPTGQKYRGRMLTITSPGYAPATVFIDDLQPKQVLTYQAIDPNSTVDAGCYRGHRNKGMEELKNMNYQEARDQFVVARGCTDVDSLENENNIALVDTILHYREIGEQKFKLLDYYGASEYYNRVMELNPYDNLAANRYNNCLTKFFSECDMTYKQADFYYNEKQFDKARELYALAVKNNCPTKVQAQEQINHIDQIKVDKKSHARVFTYEFSKDTPIGFSYGKYKKHKVGGFFSMSLNSKVFEMMRNDCRTPDMPEVNVNFGWTVKIVNPVWIFFGPGATTKVYYGKYEVTDDHDDIYPNKKGYPNDPDGVLKPKDDEKENKKIQEYTKDDQKANLAWAISPVIGVCAKYSYFALRLTYQYRFAMDSHLKDFMGSQRLSIGVGVSF